jgi:hypothetical protein
LTHKLIEDDPDGRRDVRREPGGVDQAIWSAAQHRSTTLRRTFLVPRLRTADAGLFAT